MIAMEEGTGRVKEEDDRMCRICHAGEDEGKLISPCKCKGSIKYVHIDCLDRWRKVSQNSKSYFQCENCHYKYNFQRTTISKYLKSTFLLQITTFSVFFLLIILSGYLWKFFEWMTLDPATRMWTSFIFIDLYHLMTGAILVGLVGFFQLLFIIRGPLHLGGWYGTGDRNSVEVVILAIVVIVGLVKAFISLYGFVNRQTEKFLGKMENMVLEVQ